MSSIRLLILFLLLFTAHFSEAQSDSALQAIQNRLQLQVKYINKNGNNIDRYRSRIRSLTQNVSPSIVVKKGIKYILIKGCSESVTNLFGNNITQLSSKLCKNRVETFV
jgi:hypothetical protein